MVGLPLLNNFVGEFLILSSTFIGISRSWTIAACLGVILGAAYMLWLVQRIFYGPKSEMVTTRPAPDLRLGELAVLCPLALLMLVMGLAPSIWLQAIEQVAHSPQSRVSAVVPSGSVRSSFIVSPMSGEVQR